jgi:hypothetical protein
MRTKVLLCAAALAAGAVSGMAQNVYSLNVVGYVNKSFPAGQFVMVGNPLQNTNSDLNTLFPNPPDSTLVNRWNASIQDLDPSQPTYHTTTHTWNPNVVIPQGEGFFVIAGADFTNTFVGNVLQGSITNPVPILGGGTFTAVANPVPIGGALSNVLSGYVATDSDVVNTWNVSIQDLDPSQSVYHTSTGKWNPAGNVAVGDGFFLIRAGGAATWVQNFTVQ